MMPHALASSAVLTLKGDGDQKIVYEREAGSVSLASDPDASKLMCSGEFQATDVHTTCSNLTVCVMAATITAQQAKIATQDAEITQLKADMQLVLKTIGPMISPPSSPPLPPVSPPPPVPSYTAGTPGNCKAIGFPNAARYGSLQSAELACNADVLCEAVYYCPISCNGGTSGNPYVQRYTCCTSSPRPSWCADDQGCTLTGNAAALNPSCNTGQGGTTYFKLTLSSPP